MNDETPPDRTSRVLAVLLLAAMIAFSATAQRDDEAWKAMTKMFSAWLPADSSAKSGTPKSGKPEPAKPEAAEPAEQNAD